MRKEKQAVDTRPAASITASIGQPLAGVTTGIGLSGPKITVLLDRGTDWDKMTAIGDAIADVLMKEGFRIDLEHKVVSHA